MWGTNGKALILVIVPLILYVVLLPVMPLMEPDESRYSLIAASMNETGNYITPHLKGVIYLEKPPLASWATAVFFKLFGKNEFSSRLFAGLSTWGCILLLYFMGLYFCEEKTGLYAAAVFATSLFIFSIGRINILDMPVTFFLSLSIWSGYRYLVNVENKRWLYLFYMAAALAFLTKGLIGVIFPMTIAVMWLVALGRWRDISRLFRLDGIMIFLVIAVPWILLIQREQPGFFYFFFIQEHFLRYMTTVHQHNEPLYFYLPVIVLGTLPWCILLLVPFMSRKKGWLKGSFFSRDETLLLLFWAGFILLFFSLSSSKLIPYIGAVFLPLSLFEGRIFRLYEAVKDEVMIKGKKNPLLWPSLFVSAFFSLALLILPFLKRTPQILWPWIIFPLFLQLLIVVLPDFIQKKTGDNWFFAHYLLWVLFLGALLFPLSQLLSPYKSAYPLTLAIKKYVPENSVVYQYDMSLYGLDFYGNMTTPVVNDFGELSYGIEYLEEPIRRRLFLSFTEFNELGRQQVEIYCVTKGKDNVAKLRKAFSHVTLLWNNGYYYLVRGKGYP